MLGKVSPVAGPLVLYCVAVLCAAVSGTPWSRLLDPSGDLCLPQP